jgi:MinD-like ATPase involved in chromosome partitioning or flagellar assembly
VTIVAVAGDVCTTTTVALAAAWPTTDQAIVVEADPTAGDLAAWFDLPVDPSLSTLVARAGDGDLSEIDRHTRLARSGMRLIVAPQGAAEAHQAVVESARSVVPVLAGVRAPTALVDVGRLTHQPPVHPFLAAASVIVLVHRQSTQSAAAAAVRLQRFVDQIAMCDAMAASIVVTVVGAVPFQLDQIEAFVADAVGARPLVGLPEDQLAAAVFAGRVGVSPRRLARLPLSRASGHLADVVQATLSERIVSSSGSHR